VATRERWLAGRAAGVRTIDSGQVAVTSGGHVRLCAADEAPPDGCDFHSHADERSVEERTFSCQVEQAWLVRFATDLKQSDGTFGIATLWCRGGQGKALLVERAA
jgi:hypothetical protein